MSENTILDLDAMLDGTLDNVAAAPDFVTPPPGDYVLLVKDAVLEKYKGKEGKPDGARFKLTYQVVQTVELSAKTTEPPVADGTLFNDTFLYSEEGLPYFKKAAQNILNLATTDGATIRELLDGLKGTEFPARITVRKSTVGDKTYENASVRAMHATPAS